MKRLYQAAILDHLNGNQQMLFLMGPRQVGKTTTCRSLAEVYEYFYYFTWDDSTDRQLILQGQKAIADHLRLDQAFSSMPVIVFDEIHKYFDWKNFLKGFYDKYSDRVHIVVTGSARLDVYKKGGDSLMGRYFLYHFHPLSVAEIIDPRFPKTLIKTTSSIITDEDFNNLYQYGGYPNLYLKADQRVWNRWSHLRTQQLLQEDIRDLTRVQELQQIELLANLLRLQIGQQTSYDSLAKKIRVSGHSIRNWLETLCSLYYCFELRPWSKNISRSLIKEPKYYLWDWSLVQDAGARAENFVASHLLKAVQFWTDAGFGQYGLYYLRDKDKREVDFIVTQNDEPWFLVEVKSSDNKGISPSLEYFQKQTGAPHAFQTVIDLPGIKRDCFKISTPVIVPARTLLAQLI